MQIKPAHIKSWISKHFDYKVRSNGRQISINNPFDDDRNHKMWISLEKTKSKNSKKSKYWVHDWRTDEYNMSFVSFVQKFNNISYHKAVAEICQVSVSDLKFHKEEKEEKEEKVFQLELPPSSREFSGKLKKSGQAALNYLNNRLITMDDIEKHGLYYTPVSVVFPYYEYDNVEYWQERMILDKVFNFPNESETGLKKSDYLYNFDNIENPDGTMVIVESIIDCICIGDDCCASGGSLLSSNSKQLIKIKMLRPDMIILAPDRDDAGLKSLKHNYYVLKDVARMAYCFPPVGFKDWNQLDMDRGRGRGRGSSRDYITSNTRLLDASVILRLSV